LNDDVEGLIHISEISEKRIEHPKEVLKEGDTVTLRIIKIDPANHRIGLSVRRVDSMAYADMDWQSLEEDLFVVDEEPKKEEAKEVIEVKPEETKEEKPEVKQKVKKEVKKVAEVKPEETKEEETEVKQKVKKEVKKVAEVKPEETKEETEVKPKVKKEPKKEPKKETKKAEKPEAE
jgi:predicted RNA-binding protein with RPS1 domain